MITSNIEGGGEHTDFLSQSFELGGSRIEYTNVDDMQREQEEELTKMVSGNYYHMAASRQNRPIKASMSLSNDRDLIKLEETAN
jgi:hypothetical protein